MHIKTESVECVGVHGRLYKVHIKTESVGCMADFIRKEGNVLFNDALNTFYFTVIWRRIYGRGPIR